MNTYICSQCQNEIDAEGMVWACPSCNAPASDIFYIGTDIPGKAAS